MKRARIILTFAGFCFITTLFSADPVKPSPPKASPWNPTNALNKLPPTDRLWLLGEQLKQLVGDWVNQQGDIGMDLMFYLEEPVRILTEEVKRIDREHQKDVAGLQKEIAELRAEIQALRQFQGGARTNSSGVPPPQSSAASTNSSEPRKVP
jgi:hypothetical protein